MGLRSQKVKTNHAKTTCPISFDSHPYYLSLLLGGQHGHAKFSYLETLLPNGHFEGPCYISRLADTPTHPSRDDVMCKPMGWHGDWIPSHSQHIRFGTPFARPTAQHACHFGLRWNHIGKCSKWICFADCTKQACIRQNHSKILGGCVQFTSHAAANIHCSVRFLRFQS